MCNFGHEDQPLCWYSFALSSVGDNSESACLLIVRLAVKLRICVGLEFFHLYHCMPRYKMMASRDSHIGITSVDLDRGFISWWFTESLRYYGIIWCMIKYTSLYAVGMYYFMYDFVYCCQYVILCKYIMILLSQQSTFEVHMVHMLFHNQLSLN